MVSCWAAGGCSRPTAGGSVPVTIGPFEASEIDAAGVRACCAAEPVLGRELARRVAKMLASRLQATRMKLLAISGLWVMPSASVAAVAAARAPGPTGRVPPRFPRQSS
jgi:hypothetical protein